MDHDAIQAQLFSFYDGELAGDVRRTIETHLQGCAECRMLVAQWTRVAGRLFQAPAIQPSEAFVERTTRRIASTRPQPVRISRWLADRGWLIPAMGVAAAFFLVMAQWPLQQTVSIESVLLSHEEGADDSLEQLLEEPS
ncbi:MAG: hypothetical protein COV75_07750 [Candidatus Omnitrophica bacterium CG11_big_fil_rev_8_21_14_0_20_63_9]|nr:MAG: hypothetical protein COV75_07750 [Candidatus Omnitrophica bacterium CG11_big_fil_rev_8_21_14_0_20_63_9]